MGSHKCKSGVVWTKPHHDLSVPSKNGDNIWCVGISPLCNNTCTIVHLHLYLDMY